MTVVYVVTYTNTCIRVYGTYEAAFTEFFVSNMEDLCADTEQEADGDMLDCQLSCFSTKDLDGADRDEMTLQFEFAVADFDAFVEGLSEDETEDLVGRYPPEDAAEYVVPDAAREFFEMKKRTPAV